MVEKYKLYYRLFIVLLWFPMVWGFVSQELLPILEPLSRPLFLLADILFLGLGCLLLRKKDDILVVGTFAVIGCISTIWINHESVLSWFNGSRSYLGLLFAVPVLRYFMTFKYSGDFKNSIDRQLKFWLWLQAFCIVWQVVKYGAGDRVGGSIGNWGSGMVSMLIYLVSFYLVSQNWDSKAYLKSLYNNRCYILLLIPSFLNETKVSFILFALYFLLLLRVDRTLWAKMIFIIPVFVTAIIGVGTIYFQVTKLDSERVLSKEFMQDYLYGLDLDQIVELALLVHDKEIEPDSSEWWAVDVPRFSKIALVIPVLSEHDGGVMFGAGLGQFKGGQMVEQTSFYKNNAWLLQGTKPWAFFVLVELGVVGLCWLFPALYRAVIFRRKLGMLPKRMQAFVTITVSIILVYNDSLSSYGYCLFLFYLTMISTYFGSRKDALVANG